MCSLLSSSSWSRAKADADHAAGLHRAAVLKEGNPAHTVGVAFPARKKTSLDKWAIKRQRPTQLSRVEQLSLRRAAEASYKKARPLEEGKTPRAIIICERGGSE